MALVWYQRALDGCEEAFGKDHPYTFSTVHGMAITFQKQGDYGKALVWYQRALDGYEKALGKDHLYTLSAVHGMASTFQAINLRLERPRPPVSLSAPARTICPRREFHPPVAPLVFGR